MAAVMDDNFSNFRKAVLSVCPSFKIESLYTQQENALFQFICGKDVFVNLPTGYGKSIIFQMAPLVASRLDKFSPDSIIIVISPLIALMKDQVTYLTSIGIPAAFVTAEQDENVLNQVENGEFRVVYASPESMLSANRWRLMLSSDVYKERLIGIAVDKAHCISHWGFCGNKGKVAFRRWYACLHEIRSLLPKKLPVMALTATASKKTKKRVLQVLEFSFPFEVIECPSRSNITYSTQLLEKGSELIDYFRWLVHDIKEKGINTDRVLVYCQTVKQCTQLYQAFTIELLDSIFSDSSHDPRKRLVEMLHSKTPTAVKDNIINSFSNENGCVRVLFATIAFGMGINAKGVRCVIHVGPSKNLEAYIQESGRCGRDGHQSRSILLYNNKMCIFCDEDIKCYVVSEECKRKIIQQSFDSGVNTHNIPEILHNCCNNCAKKCKCNDSECKSSLFLPIINTYNKIPVKKRDVSFEQKKILHEKLQSMKKVLVIKAMQGDQKGRNATVISCPSFFLEFTHVQIKQVLDNIEYITSIADVMSHVEVWQYKHAEEIYKIIFEVFRDVSLPDTNESDDSEDSECEDDCLIDWAEMLADDSFQEMQNSDLFGGSFQFSDLIPDIEEDAGQAIYPAVLDSILGDINIDAIDEH